MKYDVFHFEVSSFFSKIFKFCVMQISKLMMSSVIPPEDGSHNQKYLQK